MCVPKKRGASGFNFSLYLYSINPIFIIATGTMTTNTTAEAIMAPTVRTAAANHRNGETRILTAVGSLVAKSQSLNERREWVFSFAVGAVGAVGAAGAGAAAGAGTTAETVMVSAVCIGCMVAISVIMWAYKKKRVSAPSIFNFSI